LHAWQSIQYARSETGAVPAFEPAAAAIAAKAESADSGRPLNGYRRIWERNLFNASGEPAQPQEIAVEKLALAEKDLGLTLVGTVVSGDARLRRAFIFSSKARVQEAFREGDTAGEARIKRILRNKVVVATRQGDRVLSADIFETGRQATISAPPEQAAGSSPFPQAAGGGEPEVGVIEARLKRAQVESGLSEDDHLMKQVRVFPYTDTQGVQQGGFRLSYLMAGNVLVQMGLRSGDVILGVNGEAVAGLDDADGFFEKLAQGGDVTIQAMRRGRPVQLQLKIE
jgi:type II secretory pathway component PulC